MAMKRVILHWTAGTNNANALDRRYYHYLIQGDGSIVQGDYTPEDNLETADGRYAAHVKNANTGAIGVALCGMLGAVESPFNPGQYPITEEQWIVACEMISGLCKRYAIPVTPSTVLTHAEVQGTLKIAQSGKWDITRLPWEPGIVGATAVGDHLRQMIVTPAPLDAVAAWWASAPPGAHEWLRSAPAR
jgi:N-acetyl-anhydromuramyl-L-alanine amidase AmpD